MTSAVRPTDGRKNKKHVLRFGSVKKYTMESLGQVVFTMTTFVTKSNVTEM